VKPDPSPATEASGAAADGQPGRWRRFGRGCWCGFRWCTRAGYVVVALVAYALVHLHQIGLPNFLKEPLVAQLASQGLKLDYSRLHLEFGQGVVAENVTVHFRGASPSQFVYFEQIQLKLNWDALGARNAPLIRALGLTGGEASVPVEGSLGDPTALMRLTQLAGEVEFVGDDEWRLVGLSGHLNNLEVEVMGTVNHVGWLAAGSSKSRSDFQVRSPALAKVMSALERMQFQESPHVELSFAVNGKDLDQSVVQLRFGTVGARSEYGEFDGVRLSVNVQPAQATRDWLRGVVHLQSEAVRTPWGAFASLQWRADLLLPATNQPPSYVDWRLTAQSLERSGMRLGEIRARGTSMLTNQLPPAAAGSGSRALARTEVAAGSGYLTRLEIGVGDFTSRWAVATNATLEATLWNRTNQWNPEAVDWELQAGPTRTPDLRVDSLFLRGSALPVALAHQPVLTQFWTNLAPWRFQIESAATHLTLRTGESVESARLESEWKAGRLALSNLTLQVPEGRLRLSGTVEVATRQAVLAVQTRLALRALDRFLPARLWSQVTNQGVHPDNRLQLDLTARGELPPWETPATNWVEAFRSTVAIQGGVQGTNLAWNGVVVDGVEARFGAASERITLESLRVVEDAGELNVRGELDLDDGRYEAQVDSSLDPLAFRPLLKASELGRQFDLIRLASPPVIGAEAWGNFKRPGELGFRAAVALTNATYRREPVTELRTVLTFTNQSIVFTGTDVRQGTNAARAPWMRYDLKTQLLHLTNAIANLDLGSVGRIIGPKTAQVLGPYYFSQAPQVQLDGAIPISLEAKGDVVFQARAPELEWWYLRFTNLFATVRWHGDQLTITNVAAGFYGGLMSAEIGVNLANPKDVTFRADSSFADVQVDLLMSDLATSTNQLGGLLSGQIIIDEGQGRKGEPWKGSGNAQIRDGDLWGLPLFGMLSPVFDTIAPGMGKARFNAGNAFFTLTNNLVDFSKVELLSSVMRIDMRGAVSFEGDLDLVLEARPLRGVPMLGAVLDFVLAPFTKLFEYEVGGTLGQPVAELKNVPSFLLAPLRPFKTLKTIFGGPELKPVPVLRAP